MPDLNTDWLVSVDDHAIEPPNVWLDRLPARYHDVAPRMVQTDGGEAWQYEDKQIPTSGLSVAAGKRHEDFSPDPVPFSEMRPGAYDSVARLADMDQAGILASLCFPSFPRFCGQIFWEAKDKELAALCVRAYNDWMIDEWCGSAPGRYIPLVIIPLWDPPAAAKELERCAAKGATSFAFSENPEPLGLPTIHDPSRYWDPVLAAAQDLQMVVSMHVGSSSTMPSISSNAPALASLTFGASRAAATMLSWLFSDYFQRMPGLKIALSEGNIGWMPYFIERAEQVVDRQRHWIKKSKTEFYNLKVADSTQADLDRLNVRESFRDHIYGCFIEETVRPALPRHHRRGQRDVSRPTIRTPTRRGPTRSRSRASSSRSCPIETQYKILRGNAERLYPLHARGTWLARRAAVDRDGHARDVGRRVGAQKRNDCSRFGSGLGASERDASRDPGGERDAFVDGQRRQAGIGEAVARFDGQRCDGVAADAVGAEFGGEHGHHLIDGGPGCPDRPGTDRGSERGMRGEQHQGPGTPARDHRLRRRLGQQPGARQVDVQAPSPGILRQLQQQAVACACSSCSIEDAAPVEPAESVEGMGEQRRDVLPFQAFQPVSDHPAAAPGGALGDFGDDVFEGLVRGVAGVAVADQIRTHQVGSHIGQLQGRGVADARRPGDA